MKISLVVRGALFFVLAASSFGASLVTINTASLGLTMGSLDFNLAPGSVG